jgi:hypothetical protein
MACLLCQPARRNCAQGLDVHRLNAAGGIAFRTTGNSGDNLSVFSVFSNSGTLFRIMDYAEPFSARQDDRRNGARQ